jgi:hypothetical protein
MRRAVVVPVLAMTAAVVWFLASGGQPATGPPTSTTSPSTAIPSTGPTKPSPTWQPTSVTRSTKDPPTPSLVPGGEHAWEPAVRQFGIRHGSPHQRDVRSWSNALKPYVSPAVFNKLRTIGSATIRRGQYGTAELIEMSEDRIVAKISYAEGWFVVAYLEPHLMPGSWRVEAYYRAQDEGSR